MDISALQTFCPFCGEKLLITTEQVKDILDGKKEDKRKGVKYEKDVEVRTKNVKKKKKIQWIRIAGAIVLIMFMAGIALLAYKRVM